MSLTSIIYLASDPRIKKEVRSQKLNVLFKGQFQAMLSKQKVGKSSKKKSVTWHQVQITSKPDVSWILLGNWISGQFRLSSNSGQVSGGSRWPTCCEPYTHWCHHCWSFFPLRYFRKDKKKFNFEWVNRDITRAGACAHIQECEHCTTDTGSYPLRSIILLSS